MQVQLLDQYRPDLCNFPGPQAHGVIGGHRQQALARGGRSWAAGGEPWPGAQHNAGSKVPGLREKPLARLPWGSIPGAEGQQGAAGYTEGSGVSRAILPKASGQHCQGPQARGPAEAAPQDKPTQGQERLWRSQPGGSRQVGRMRHPRVGWGSGRRTLRGVGNVWRTGTCVLLCPHPKQPPCVPAEL